MPAPKCPRCGGKGSPVPGDLFRCSKCGGCFDDNPHEGGSYSDRSPAARLEREERAAARHRAARVRRGSR